MVIESKPVPLTLLVDQLLKLSRRLTDSGKCLDDLRKVSKIERGAGGVAAALRLIRETEEFCEASGRSGNDELSRNPPHE